jgi:hypothetical protein
VFYTGWRIVQALCETNFKMPKEVDLPTPAEREVARIYVERREFAVVDVVEATGKFAQPHLLETTAENVTAASFEAQVAPETATIVGPFPMSV